VASKRVGEAEKEASRCIQCECLECVKGCEYLRAYKKLPKHLLREIYNNLSIVMGNHLSNGLINACAICGQCKAICPNGLDVGDVVLAARKNMVDTGKMPPRAFEFALLDMAHAQSGEYHAALMPEGMQSCEYVFFPGCQMGAVLPQTLIKTYQSLESSLAGGVGLLLSCCGIMSLWAGQTELFEESIEKLKGDLASLGNPKVITACPTCSATLSAYVGVEAIPITQLLLDLGIPGKALGFQGEAMQIHDSCGFRLDETARESVREAANAAGIELSEGELSGDEAPCCGYGGLQAYSSPEIARQMTVHALGDGSYENKRVLTYCANCRERFLRAGAKPLHILEAMYGEEPGPAPSLSQRRRNRQMARQGLLSEFWGETFVEEKRPYEAFFSPKALAEMEERMILESDIYAVLDSVYGGGPSVKDKDSGYSYASARVGNVAFWAEFQRVPGGYEIVGAYSHRMDVTGS